MPRGQPLKSMNPFSNNKPRLTASERIRNKRDAAIYQGEKQRFQRGKHKCRNRNVKFYRNGKVRSVVNYKMQKSLARGNVLCNDCDDKGNLCAAPSKKDDLASVYMGNNNYSELWGGQSVTVQSGSGTWRQLPGNTLINSDISGVWGGSLTDVSKADLSNATLPASIIPNVPLIPIPFGYVNNLIKIPRNLDGSGITIDPSNILFPDELCDPFRYLKKTYLKTYLVLTACLTKPGPCDPVSGICSFLGIECNDSSLNSMIGTVVSLGQGDYKFVGNGIVSSICCIGSTDRMATTFFPPTQTKGNFGIFNIYIELSFAAWMELGSAINFHNNKAFTPWSILPIPFGNGGISVVSVINPINSTSNTINSTANGIIFWWMIQSINLIQGSIPPSQNQTKYNATKQSYMYCLENGTRKINFTKQNTRIPVKNAFCTPSIPVPPSPPACVPEISFTIQLIIGTPVLPTFVNLSDGKYLLFDIGSNTNTTWNFNIINILDSCTGEAGNLKIDYLVVGGGGSGGSFGGGGAASGTTTSGGGGGEVRTGSFDISGNSSFEIEVGRGDDPTAGGLNWNADYANRFFSLNSPYDASGSTLTVTDIATSTPIQTQNASAGQHGANTTGRNNDNSTFQTFLRATDGGASGSQSQSNGGSVLNPDPSGTPYNYPGTPTGNIAFNAPANGFINNMRGSAGGGSNANDGGDSGGTDCSANDLQPNDFLCSGGNGGNGLVSSITGTTQYYGAGGGGAAISTSDLFAFTINAGAGGLGGGGNGAFIDLATVVGPVILKGDNGTGYGAGGGGSILTDVSQAGGKGYRGVVILKFYKAPA